MSHSLKSALGVALLLSGSALAGLGCGSSEPSPAPQGNMGGAMESGKMQGGAMESGKMESGKMESGGKP